ncbi:MAG TPA: hypothetical protein VG406_24670 [Isosphaeraceae bacterium]|jgi:outer membrane murein-binding lipoprotein Lpp|nr:hypothetical protein [Isosphaeraceae bacterium]
MTTVGKILVIVILACSILFCAFSLVAFTTTTNWREKVEKQAGQIRDLNQKITQAKAEVEARDKDIQTLTAQNKTEVNRLDARIADRDRDNKRLQDEIAQQRTLQETAQALAKSAQAEANQRVAEAKQLDDLLRQVQKQANAYKDQERDLNDKIRLLERDLQVAVGNNKTLRERTAALSYKLRQNNLSDDVTQLVGRKAPPTLDGYVRAVDWARKNIEISLGSDQELAVGDVLYVYRLKPTPEYLGKIRITIVDHDQSVARLEGQTVGGKKIQEGDHVTTKIGARAN